MKYAQNIAELAQLPIDYIGFIFYNQSTRYVESLEMPDLPPHIQKVGVFVNATLEDIGDKVHRYNLQAVQLHGKESPEICAAVRDTFSVQVIKAFSVGGADSFTQTEAYANACDLFLFDTQTPLYGGSGKQFDWSVLPHYTGTKPFLLSGGIGPNDAAAVRAFSHPAWEGIDLNSRFETAAALKNVAAIRHFIERVRY